MKIGIIGTGAFSVAIANLISENKENKITLWSENKELVEEFAKTHKIEALFKDVTFANNITITNSYDEVLKEIDVLFIVTSIPYLEEVSLAIKDKINKNIPICLCTKGIYGEKNLFAYQIVKSILKNPLAILSGPTFALDMINKNPIGFNIACKSKKQKELYQKLFNFPYVKVIFTNDLLGISIVGSLKNIYAIGSGIIDGLGFKESTKAYYLTNVFQELNEVLYKFKAEGSTLHTLAGIGDLIATCSSTNSRNFTLGKMISSKKSKKEIVEYKEKNTLEGCQALKHILPLLDKKKCSAPIINSLYKIVFEGEDANTLLTTLQDNESHHIF